MTTPRGRSARGERGMALLSALLAVALLTVIVVEMTDATLVHTHLTRNAGNAMAAQLLARSAEVAGEALVASNDTNDPDVTCPNGLWAAPILGVPVGPGVVGLQISDEGGKLDLNLVGDNANYRAAVEELFTLLDLDPELVERIAAWIKQPTSGAPMATGDASDYCALPMPCQPRQRPMTSLEELLLIRGFDDRTVRVLRPYVTVIPRTDARSQSRPRVNLNTADWRVLRALGCEVGESDAPPACPSFPTKEQKDDWQKEIDAWKNDHCADAPGKEWLDTDSDFFSIRASGTVGDVTQVLRTLVQRRGERAHRLWWQERPVADVMPVEIS